MSKVATMSMIGTIVRSASLHHRNFRKTSNLTYSVWKSVKCNKIHQNEGSSHGKSSSSEEGLSEKIDSILQEAKLDVSLVGGLTQSIKKLEASASALSPAVDAVSSSNNYSEQLAEAASQLESLNKLYSAQVADAGSQTTYNEKVAENAKQLHAQMEAMSANLASLNQVYGGMLSAMNKN